MIKKIIVKLFDNEVGEISIMNDLPLFKFNESFLNKGIEISPVLFPLDKFKNHKQKPIHLHSLNYEGSPFYGLPGFIADSLPDKFGNELIEEWLKKTKRTKTGLTILEKLSYIGDRGMGALEFEPVVDSLDFSIEEDLNLQELFDIVNKILSKKETLNEQVDTQLSLENVKQIVSVGTSAGGARSKAIIAIKEDENGKIVIKSGANKKLDKGFEHFLIKFDSPLNKDKEEADGVGHTNVEYAYYLMAKECEIDMNYCQLIGQGKMRHFITKRFDRISNKNGEIEKLHMMTLCGMLHSDFNKSQDLDYLDVFNVIEKIVPLENVMQTKAELFKRLVFNVVGRNQDDHTKNFSFLMDRNGVWRLSPFYDVSFAYNPNGMWTSKHQMSILGFSKNEEITTELLLEMGEKIGLSKEFCVKIIEKTNGVFEKMEFFMNRAKVKQERIDQIKKHIHILKTKEYTPSFSP